jgi:hypothetical protein
MRELQCASTCTKTSHTQAALAHHARALAPWLWLSGSNSALRTTANRLKPPRERGSSVLLSSAIYHAAAAAALGPASALCP